MAVDQQLAGQMSDDLAGFGPQREVRMFGGLCCMWRGNKLRGIQKGRALYRVGKANHAAALALDMVGPMTMAGRGMGGLVEAGPLALTDAATRARRWRWRRISSARCRRSSQRLQTALKGRLAPEPRGARWPTTPARNYTC